MLPHGLLSQKLKKLQEAESLPFCPTVAVVAFMSTPLGEMILSESNNLPEATSADWSRRLASP